MITYYILINGEEQALTIPELDNLYIQITQAMANRLPSNELVQEFDKEITIRFGDTARFVGAVI